MKGSMCCNSCCENIDDLETSKNEVKALKSKLEYYEINDNTEGIIKILAGTPHNPDCFTKYAGCVCLKENYNKAPDTY